MQSVCCREGGREEESREGRMERGEKEGKAIYCEPIGLQISSLLYVPVNMAGGLVRSPALVCTTTLSSTNLCGRGRGGEGREEGSGEGRGGRGGEDGWQRMDGRGWRAEGWENKGLQCFLRTESL